MEGSCNKNLGKPRGGGRVEGWERGEKDPTHSRNETSLMNYRANEANMSRFRFLAGPCNYWADGGFGGTFPGGKIPSRIGSREHLPGQLGEACFGPLVKLNFTYILPVVYIYYRYIRI